MFIHMPSQPHMIFMPLAETSQPTELDRVSCNTSHLQSADGQVSITRRKQDGVAVTSVAQA